ncbi:hypothetical protein [Streptomyces sp. NPDC093568]|uniref:hypothetical protein n=1 Tax=Streptomyces sp. NPDC093568 TaxID=3366041 RepID=UPI0038246F9D
MPDDSSDQDGVPSACGRRLNSDRFFTEYYTPEVYSKARLRWIDENTMGTVLLRHHPDLRTALAGVKNAFQPWNIARRE